LDSDIENGTANDFIIEDGVLIHYNGTDSVVTVPDGVNAIGENAFHTNLFVTKIILPDTVLCINKCAFFNCRYLREIIMQEGLLFIGAEAMCGCTALKNISIPDSVLKIGKCAFQYCHSLGHIKLPPNLLYLGDYAFASCSSIKIISIPASVKHLGMCTFAFCSGLIKLILPEELDEAPFLSLFGCDQICRIVLTGKKADIVNKAHRYCFDYLIHKKAEGDTIAHNLVELNALTHEDKDDYPYPGTCYHTIFRARYTEALEYLIIQPLMITQLAENKALSGDEADFLLHNEKTSIECRTILMEYLFSLHENPD